LHCPKISDKLSVDIGRESFMERLECLFCGKRYPLDVFDIFCPSCREPMIISATPRKRAFSLDRSLSIEKYQSFIPLAKVDKGLSLGEGDTPLVLLERIQRKYQLPPVYAKNETLNPTCSFKDRGTAVAVQKAVALGRSKIGTVSTGNMAGSTAAYGAKAGLTTIVLLKEDIPMEKVGAAGIYGPVLLKVKGDYGSLFSLSYDIGKKHGIYFMNSVDPWRIEGYKVIGYEIFQQLGGRIPRYLFTPVSSGALFIGLQRAFLDLREERLSRELPVFIGVQAKGCSPLARAFAQGKNRYSRFARPQTIAHSISNPSPPGGNLVLKLARENAGMIMAVTDKEILAAQKDLAELEGIFADPASATVLAALIKLSQRIRLNLREAVVLIISGSGLKTIESLESQEIQVHRTSLSRLEKSLGFLLE
jgi:threonine synthase